jgi:mannitol/fructose-specific phosphotransferase system IIA component (Ntr-type)/Kef-type K+ transport system membrane component KefB
LTSESTILSFAAVLLAGVVGGDLALRLRLPKVTGWICGGLALRAVQLPTANLDWNLSRFGPFVDFALGYIAFVVGSALHGASLRNARGRLGLLMLAEVTVTPVIVASSLVWIGGLPLAVAWLLAAIAIAGAPGTSIVVLKEAQARGVFTRTLTGALPLVDLACLLVFSLVSQLLQLEQTDAPALSAAPLLAARGLTIATVIGAVSALLPAMISTRWFSPSSAGPGFAATIMLAWGVSRALGVPAIVACTVAGITLTNLRHQTAREGQAYLAPFADTLFAAFYVLAGMRIDLSLLAGAFGLVVLYVAARVVAKALSSYAAMSVARTIPGARRYLGLALLPHGGVAIGLIVVIQETPALATFSETIATIGLSALALNQVLGPSILRFALQRVGEAGLDRARLLDFLTEQNIVVGCEGANKREVIAPLARRLSSGTQMSAETLTAALVQAEEAESTFLGLGLMVPHTFDPEDGPVRGVLGLSSRGLDLGAPDGQPVHAVLVLLIPASQRHHHLEILAALAMLLTSRPELRERLFHAPTAAHAHKLLNPVDEVGFNYFREPEPGAPPSEPPRAGSPGAAEPSRD